MEEANQLLVLDGTGRFRAFDMDTQRWVNPITPYHIPSPRRDIDRASLLFVDDRLHVTMDKTLLVYPPAQGGEALIFPADSITIPGSRAELKASDRDGNLFFDERDKILMYYRAEKAWKWGDPKPRTDDSYHLLLHLLGIFVKDCTIVAGYSYTYSHSHGMKTKTEVLTTAVSRLVFTHQHS